MQGWRRASLVWCGAVAAMAAGMCVAAAASAAGFERRDVEFDAAGTTLRGWLYVPAGASGPVPAIGMCHGRWAVKEMWLEKDAEVLAEAGLAALVYDNRNLGASDGEPRPEVDPFAQVRDDRHAISFAGTVPEVDKTRIGVWG